MSDFEYDDFDDTGDFDADDFDAGGDFDAGEEFEDAGDVGEENEEDGDEDDQEEAEVELGSQDTDDEGGEVRRNISTFINLFHSGVPHDLPSFLFFV